MITIKFNYEGVDYRYEIAPTEADWWTSADMFDIHYCEDYNEVCVYLFGDNSKTIHKQPINKGDSITYDDVYNVCNILNKDLSVEEMEEVLRRYDECSDEDDIWSAVVENKIYEVICERK